jgi:hypothetical protein
VQVERQLVVFGQATELVLVLDHDAVGRVVEQLRSVAGPPLGEIAVAFCLYHVDGNLQPDLTVDTTTAPVELADLCRARHKSAYRM